MFWMFIGENVCFVKHFYFIIFIFFVFGLRFPLSSILFNIIVNVANFVFVCVIILILVSAEGAKWENVLFGFYVYVDKFMTRQKAFND